MVTKNVAGSNRATWKRIRDITGNITVECGVNTTNIFGHHVKKLLFFFLTSHSLTTLLEKCIKRLHRLTKRGSKQNRNPIRNSKTARPNIQKKKHQPVIFFPASVYTFLARFNILRTRRQSLRGRDPFHRSARRVPHDLMRALMARLLPPNLPRRDAN